MNGSKDALGCRGFADETFSPGARPILIEIFEHRLGLHGQRLPDGPLLDRGGRDLPDLTEILVGDHPLLPQRYRIGLDLSRGLRRRAKNDRPHRW